MEYRDRYRCRFPGCGARHWLQIHHVIHWADGGPTNLDNLILLCGFHHRFLHQHHWTITLKDNGQFVFRKPDRSIYPPAPPPLHPRLKQPHPNQSTYLAAAAAAQGQRIGTINQVPNTKYW